MFLCTYLCDVNVVFQPEPNLYPKHTIHLFMHNIYMYMFRKPHAYLPLVDYVQLYL